MKFTCLKSDLSQAISNTSRAVATKNSIPALEGVLIQAYAESVNITGYNLEIGITTDIESTITQEGEIVLSSKLLHDIVRKLPEEIVLIETDEKMVTYITSGKANYQIVGISPTDYPCLPYFDSTDKITFNANILREMIKQTVYAVSENTAKPIYTGSLFEIKNGVFKIVALDGCQMAIRSENVDCNSQNSFVVPGKTQLEVLKLLANTEDDIEIDIGQRHIAFKINNYHIISRLIDGIFIDYKATIFNDSKTEILVSTKNFMNAIERMSLLNNERIQSPVRCKFSDNEIKLSCASTVGRANDILPATITGDSVDIGFNNRYVLEALKNTDTDEVKIAVNNSVSAIIIKPTKGDKFIKLIALMRITKTT